MIKILFLAANPKDTDRLRLDEEVRDIQERLRMATLGSQFAVEQELAVRVNDLQEHLLRHQPQIVHFSGHGSRAGRIVLESQSGPQPGRAPCRLEAALRHAQGRHPLRGPQRLLHRAPGRSHRGVD